MKDFPIEPPIGPPQKVFMTRQLHFWVTDVDYEFISSIAAENEQTIAETVRRMIRTARKKRSEQDSLRRASR